MGGSADADVPGARGEVVISLDAELAWGFHDLPRPPGDRIANARSSWRTLIRLFDEYDVPATWAVVGHLLLDACDGIHADHPGSPAWFERDPGGTAEEHDAWFGGDLVDRVASAAVDHEIGCHTFSHVVLGDPSTDATLAVAELSACVDLVTPSVDRPTSFTFPRNVVGHRRVLAEQGFRCYRGPAPDRWFDRLPGRRAWKLADFVLGATPPPLVVPTVDEYGLVNLPASLAVFSFEGVARRVVELLNGDPIVRQVRMGLEEASRQGGVLHLWFHPNDLTTPADVERVREILDLVAAYRDRGAVDVTTMGHVADRTLASASDDAIPARLQPGLR